MQLDRWWVFIFLIASKCVALLNHYTGVIETLVIRYSSQSAKGMARQLCTLRIGTYVRTWMDTMVGKGGHVAWPMLQLQ